MTRYEQAIGVVAAVLGVASASLDLAWEGDRIAGVAVNGAPVDVVDWERLRAARLPVLPWAEAYPARADEAPELPMLSRRLEQFLGAA